MEPDFQQLNLAIKSDIQRASAGHLRRHGCGGVPRRCLPHFAPETAALFANDRVSFSVETWWGPVRHTFRSSRPQNKMYSRETFDSDSGRLDFCSFLASTLFFGTISSQGNQRWRHPRSHEHLCSQRRFPDGQMLASFLYFLCANVCSCLSCSCELIEDGPCQVAFGISSGTKLGQ